MAGRILVSPVPDADSDWEGCLLDHVEGGGRLFLYGPLGHASEALRDLLGVHLAAGITGECTLHVEEQALLPPPNFTEGMRFRHVDVYSGGELCETGGETPLVMAQRGDERRTLAAESRRGSGTVVWFRGSVEDPVPTKVFPDDGHILYNDEPGQFSVARFSAALLQRVGWTLRYDCPHREILEPIMGLHWDRNGLWFTGAAHNALVEYELGTPVGAPVLINSDLRMRSGRAVYHFPKGWRGECRVFVEQAQDAVVSCRELHPGGARRIVVTGLQDAVIRIFPEPGREPSLTVAGPTGKVTYAVETGIFEGRTCCNTRDRITGNVVIRW